MSKLKLYNHSKESRTELEQDLAESKAILESYAQSSASVLDPLTDNVSPSVKENVRLVKEQYFKPFQELITSEEDLSTKLNKFKSFSTFLDRKFSLNAQADGLDRETRIAKDMIKYRLLCAIEAKEIDKLKKNSPAAQKYLKTTDIVNGAADIALEDSKTDPKMIEQLNIIREKENQKDFDKFIKDYESETKTHHGDVAQKLADLHAQVTDIFANLAQATSSKAHSKLAAEIKQNNPNQSDIGKISWGERLGDVWRNIAVPVGKVIDKVMSVISSMSQNDKAPNYPAPPVPSYPSPSKEVQSTGVSTLMDVPSYPPPPVPKEVTQGLASVSKKEGKKIVVQKDLPRGNGSERRARD